MKRCKQNTSKTLHSKKDVSKVDASGIYPAWAEDISKAIDTGWEVEFEKNFGVNGVWWRKDLSPQFQTVIIEYNKDIKYFIRQELATAKEEERERILPSLYTIWANIPLTWGMNARKMIKALIDELKV